MEEPPTEFIICKYSTLIQNITKIEDILENLINNGYIEKHRHSLFQKECTRKSRKHNELHLILNQIIKELERDNKLQGLVEALEKTDQSHLVPLLIDSTLKEDGRITMFLKLSSEANQHDIRAELITNLMDTEEQLHKKLMSTYLLDEIIAEAVLSTSDTLRLVFQSKHLSKDTKLTEDINNNQLLTLIKQFSSLPARQKWGLSWISEDFGLKSHYMYVHYDMCEQSLQGTFNSGRAMYTAETNLDSTLIAKAAHLPSPTFKTPYSPSQLAKNLKSILYSIIQGKDQTLYDFWKVLVRCKTSSVGPPDLKTNDGFNLLHTVIDKGRLSFLPAFVQIGWWAILSKERVPENSFNEHSGKTAKQIAETKRAKKPLQEFNDNNEWENSLSSLMKACRSGDVSRAKQLARQSGEEIYYRDYNGGNSLYWAVINGALSLINELVEMGVDSTVRTKKNENLLHIASAVGNSNVISTLLQKSLLLDPELKDQAQKTPLARNAENGDIETLKEFVKFDIKPEPECAVISAFTGRSAYMMYLFDNLGIPINSIDVYSRTPLHRACEGSKVSVVSYLLEKGADIELITCTGRNLLHIIAENGNELLLSMVIQLYKSRGLLKTMINSQDKYNGVELCFLIRGRDKGRDAWHYVEVKRILVPIFLQKTRSGNVDVAAYGAVIQSGWGVNPSQDVIEEIEEEFKRRRLNKEATTDMTPLHIALFKGHTNIARVLIENGCSVNVNDCFGNTTLMIAASKGNLEMMRLLEKMGANFKETNNNGKSLADIAEANEHEDIDNYIKGRDYNHFTKNFCECQITELEEKLSKAGLERVRQNNLDVKRHIVDTYLGSGPVLEATDNNEPPLIGRNRDESHHNETVVDGIGSLNGVRGFNYERYTPEESTKSITNSTDSGYSSS